MPGQDCEQTPHQPEPRGAVAPGQAAATRGREPPPARPAHLGRFEFALLVITVLLAVVAVIGDLPNFRRLPRRQMDFAAYYLAARVLNARAPLYVAEALEQESRAAGDILFTPYIYPPFGAHLLRPLALLPYPTAATLWLAANLGALFLGTVLLARWLGWRAPAAAAACAAVLLFPAVYDCLLLGQFSILLTLLLVGVLLLSTNPDRRRRHDLLAGVLLGLAVAFKLYPAVILIVFLFYRRFAVILAAAATVAAAFLGGILLGGPADTWRWLTEVVPLLSNNSASPMNQSLTGVIQRFFTTSQFYLGGQTYVTLSPLIDSPPLSAALIALGTLLLLGITALHMTRPDRRVADAAALAVDWALAVALMLLITPIVWNSYHVHALPALAILGRWGRAVWPRRMFFLALLLLVLHRLWWRMALFGPTPWLMWFGFAGALALWMGLLLASQAADQPGRFASCRAPVL